MKFLQKKICFFLIFFSSIIFLNSHAATNWSVHWHPDGNYFAVGGDYSSSSLHPLYVYSFDKITNSFTMTDSRQMATTTDQVWSVAWSPDGNYLAAGTYKSGSTPQLRIYSFDGSRISGSPIITRSYGVSGNIVDAIAWHPSGNYVAIGGGYPGGSARSLEICAFNGTTLTLRDSKSLMSMIRDINWDSTGNYIIAGGDNSVGTDEVYTYSFANSKLSASAISTKNFGSGAIIYFTTISPDNKFALLGGSNVTGGNELQVYSFSNGVLSASALDSRNYGLYLIAARFHPNQQYVATGGENPDSGHEEFEIYGFDSQEEVFTTNPIIYLTQAGAVCSVDWSIDGCFILLGGKSDVLRTYRSYYKGLGLYAYDGTVYNVYKDSNKVIRDGENAIGWVGFRDGITVLAGAGAKLDTELPLSNGMDLRTSCSLILENNLFLDSEVTLSGCGSIYANGKTIYLNGDARLSDNSVLEFISNAVFDGQGHDVTLGKYAQLLVDGGVTVTFKNMTIKNTLNTISCPPIRCMDWYSQACFDNVTFAFNDDFAFRNGQFFIYNDVEFTGTSKFSYRSVRPSYITQHSNLILDPQTTFEYYPSTTDNALIKMQDKTSAIIFDGSTLQTTHTGIRLTVGSLYFDNKVTLSSAGDMLLTALSSTPTFYYYGGYIYSLSWSPDGRYLAIGGEGPTTHSNHELQVYEFTGSGLNFIVSQDYGTAICSVSWSPDGRYLAIGGYNPTTPSSDELQVYEFTGYGLNFVTSQDYGTIIYSVSWSPDGKYLAIGGEGPTTHSNHELQVYEFTGYGLNFVTSQDYGDDIYSVSWSPDGKYLAIGGQDPTSGDELQVYEFTGSGLNFVTSQNYGIGFISSLSWSFDGKYLAMGGTGPTSGDELQVYEFTGSGLNFVTSQDYGTSIFSVSWSPDGRYLAIGGNVPTSGNELKVYEFTGSGLNLVISQDYGTYIYSVLWSSDGKCLAVGGRGPTSGNELQVYPLIYRYETSPQAYSNSIIFGNSSLGTSQDLAVYLLSAARIGIYGKVWNDLADSGWNFQSRDSYVSLDRYDSQFRITNAESISDWKKNQIIKSSEPNTMFLQDNQVWATNMDQFAPEETFELMNNLVIPDGQITQFSTNVVIDGQGHDLILGKYAQLLVDGGITVTFKNMTIKNTLNTISCPPIRCMDWYSQACFDNVTFAFNDDFAFKNGQFFIYNDVEFTGTSKFSYRSVRPSYITRHSNLIFDPNTTFEFYPSTTDNALLKMQDRTSAIIFDGSTLQTTHTGIRLTVGSLYFDNKVTLSSADNTYTNFLDPVFQTSETDNTYPVAWSLNGRYLAVGNSGGVNRLYRLDGESLTLVDSTSESDSTYSVAWSPDGRYLAVGNYNSQVNRLYRLNGESLTLVDSTSETDNTWSVAWSPDGRYLAVGNYNQANRLYRLDGESLTLVDSTSETDATRSVEWSPDGRYLAAGNYGQVKRLYRLDGESLTLVDSTSESDSTLSVAWSPDGRYLAVGNSSQVNRLYRLDGESLTLVDSTSESDSTWSVAWSPDGRYLAAGNYGQGNRLYKPIYCYDTSPQGYSNGIIFGNSALGSDYDLDMNVLGGANIITDGKVWYDDVN